MGKNAEFEKRPENTRLSKEEHKEHLKNITALTNTVILRAVEPLELSGFDRINDFKECFHPERIKVEPFRNRAILGITAARLGIAAGSVLFKSSDLGYDEQGNLGPEYGTDPRIYTTEFMNYVNDIRHSSDHYVKVRGADPIPQRIFTELRKADGLLFNLADFLFPSLNELSLVYNAQVEDMRRDPSLYVRKKILDNLLLILVLDDNPVARNEGGHALNLIEKRLGLEFPETETKKKLKEWTADYVVGEKTKEWEKPSGKLRFAVQVIVYNEIPIRPFKENPRGNLAEYLMSVVNAANEFDKAGGSVLGGGASEIEFLVNINNREEVQYEDTNGYYNTGTKANKNALKLMAAINGDIKTPEECVREFDWLPNNGEDSQEVTTKFYILLITRAKELRVKGMQFHVADCTDGMYIARKNVHDEISFEQNQASRRELLSRAAEERFRQSANLKEKVHIVSDADITMSKKYFIVQAENFNMLEKNANARCYLSPLRIVSPLDVELQNSDHTVGRREAALRTIAVNAYFLFRDLSLVALEIKDNLSNLSNLSKRSRRIIIMFSNLMPGHKSVPKGIYNYTPFVETMVFNRQAFKSSGGWNIHIKGEGSEDTEFQLALNNRSIPTYYNDNVITTRKNRIREHAWLGIWHNGEVRDVSFNPIMKIVIASFQDEIRGRYGNIFENLITKDMSPYEFTNFFHTVLRKIPDLTQRENQLLQEYGISVSDKKSPQQRIRNAFHLSSNLGYRRRRLNKDEDIKNQGEVSRKNLFLAELGTLLSVGRRVMGSSSATRDYPNLCFIFGAFGKTFDDAINTSKVENTYRSFLDPLIISYDD